MIKALEILYIVTLVEDGVEKVAIHPDGVVPLIYLSEEAMENDRTVEMVQSIADTNNVTFKIKKFQCVDMLDVIEPMKSRMTQ